MKKMLFILMCVLPVFCARAKWISVDDDDPAADFSRIQDAIDHPETTDGDIIVVKSGTYAENISFNGKLVEVTSLNPDNQSTVEQTIITAGSDYSVRFDFGETSGAILAGFTITGRGIHCYSSSPTITKNIIRDCTNTGITGENNAAPHIAGNKITNNPTGVSGCSGLVADNVITGNYNGGGLVDCYAPIVNNVVSYNRSVSGVGGGMLRCGGDIVGNVVAYNQAGVSGGGMSTCYGQITDNMIVGNRAGDDGGGLYYCNEGLSHNVIAGNRAGGGGGLAYCYTPMANNTIVGNRAGAGGAMAYCYGSIRNNIIAYNEADDTGGLYSVTGNSYNSFWANLMGHVGGGASVGAGDEIRDPCFAQVGYWDPNGTPADANDDYWVDGDYHLRSPAGRWDPGLEMWVQDGWMSRCIDSGDPASDWSAELWPHGGLINAGRYGGTAEASMSLVTIGNVADLNLDSLVDYRDMSLFADKWPDAQVLLRDGPHWPYTENLLREDLDRNGLVDFVDYAILVANWLPKPLPSPNPMTWDTEPHAVSDTEIAMTATDANSNDGNDVEYYFEETSGNPDGNDSGWQLSNTYTDGGLAPGVEYSYRVKARNKGNPHLETKFSVVRSAATLSPPSPSPMTWAVEPNAVSQTIVTMTATTATSSDGTGVEYYFEETSGNPGGTDSGWQDERVYTDANLSEGTTYCYKVKARNKGNHLETAPSVEAGCATTEMFPPPEPNPMTWATAPYAVSHNRITMTATTATAGDGGDVQYYFDETSGNPGGTDSGWQDSSYYEDDGLEKLTQYSYRVKARNKGNLRETGWSGTLSATTPCDDLIPPRFDLGYWECEPCEYQRASFDCWALMRAGEATDNSGYVEYKFECPDKPELSSGWQTERCYRVWLLGRCRQGWTFLVKARDACGNETASPAVLPWSCPNPWPCDDDCGFVW